jgi:RHS repeat-associated protein
MKKYEQRGHDSNKGDIFAYDGIYRLIGVKFNSPEPANPVLEQFEKHKAVTFDRLSNILSIDETGNGQTQTMTTNIPADSTYSKLNQYERFDQWGLSYDLNGNLTQKSTQHNVYDYKNRIVRATDVDSTVKFKYDPLGRRIQKEVTLGSQSKTTNFYYSGHQVIEERDGSDQVTRQLIYGNGIDEVIRVDKYTGTTSTPYYFHINDMGSITAVTDANGNIIERVYYDIYGMPTFKDASGNVIPKSSIGNNILFQGREYDPELNLYYFRARYYDPIMGRFLQTDPMGYADSMNLYQAFNMNPVNFVDSMGKELFISGDSTTLPLIKTWLNKIAGFLRNGNLLKFTKYSMYNFPWSGDSHDYIGYVSNLEGTYEVEFINPSEIRESDNVGGWLICELIKSREKFIIGIGSQYPSKGGPINVGSGDVGVAANTDINYDWRMQDDRKKVRGKWEYSYNYLNDKKDRNLPPEGVDSVVWFAPHFINNFNEGSLKYFDPQTKSVLGQLDFLEFIVFHELMEAYLKVVKRKPYVEKGNPNIGAHPEAINKEKNWRRQMRSLGININLNLTGGEVIKR